MFCGLLICMHTYNFSARVCLQVKEEGYEVEHDGYCITVFSAPNYCDQMRAPAACHAIPLPCCLARGDSFADMGCDGVLHEGLMDSPMWFTAA